MKKKPQLNALQRDQLMDCIKAGATIKLNQAPKSLNKGFTDTPLFNIDQPKLF